uniref:Uncharacterized protein n=1 Tax=Oryza glumipatula TaxID=40148 RepID=A0A0D9ZGU0_9ORYZ
MSREGHWRKVEHSGHQRNLLSGSNTSGGGRNCSMAAFNREMTAHGAQVDGGGSNERGIGHFERLARTFHELLSIRETCGRTLGLVEVGGDQHSRSVELNTPGDVARAF